HQIEVMRWLSERWDAFSAAAGPRRFVIGAIISVVIALTDHVWSLLGNVSMTRILGIPSWGAGIIVALLLVAYWLLEYLVQLRRRMRGARFELAKLRTEGVVIRNEGRSISHKQALSKWEKKVGDWNSAVILSMGEINQADAEWFSVMDVIPDARLPIENTIPNELARRS